MQAVQHRQKTNQSSSKVQLNPSCAAYKHTRSGAHLLGKVTSSENTAVSSITTRQMLQGASAKEKRRSAVVANCFDSRKRGNR